jgi:redox-sensitive bicupin YhaK (pirin superfamily)
VDPFLLLDEMGPVDWQPGEAIGAPDHPHRGFETVTYMLEGRFEHEDSQGHRGVLEPGDVQWMTAGNGVVHSEMPESEFKKRGGRMHGFQLWVNLPRRDKRMDPRYQEVPRAQLPTAQTDDGLAWVRVIAGEALGARAVIDTRTPILLQHWSVQPGGRVEVPVHADHHGFAYVFRGAGSIGPQDGASAAESGQLVVLGHDGDAVGFGVPKDAAHPMELLLVTGVPIREHVVRHGPFVMNTKQEILEAMWDFENGRMGQISR